MTLLDAMLLFNAIVGLTCAVYVFWPGCEA